VADIEIVSVDSAGNQGTQNPGNYGSIEPIVSADGRFVLYSSNHTHSICWFEGTSAWPLKRRE
jgi:hypothetical protein